MCPGRYIFGPEVKAQLTANLRVEWNGGPPARARILSVREIVTARGHRGSSDKGSGLQTTPLLSAKAAFRPE